jgi:hypothetical protein
METEAGLETKTHAAEHITNTPGLRTLTMQSDDGARGSWLER